MLISLIYAGATTEKAFAEAISEYEKRIGAFCEFKSICVKEERLNDSKAVSKAEIEAALEAEAKRFESASAKSSVRVALCVEGRALSSEELSAFIETKRLEGASSFSFIIGSSHGISEKFKKSCDFLLSMSHMTFPHMLARLMLTEQLYRAFTISAGKKYHK